MVLIEENNITLTRGDTLRVKVDITDENGDIYEPKNTDEIRFAMKRKYKDKDCLIKKTIPNNTLILELKPKDTKPLQFGKDYVYDIQITEDGDVVDTFISGIITLSEEVD